MSTDIILQRWQTADLFWQAQLLDRLCPWHPLVDEFITNCLWPVLLGRLIAVGAFVPAEGDDLIVLQEIYNPQKQKISGESIRLELRQGMGVSVRPGGGSSTTDVLRNLGDRHRYKCACLYRSCDCLVGDDDWTAARLSEQLLLLFPEQVMQQVLRRANPSVLQTIINELAPSQQKEIAVASKNETEKTVVERVLGDVREEGKQGLQLAMADQVIALAREALIKSLAGLAPFRGTRAKAMLSSILETEPGRAGLAYAVAAVIPLLPLGREKRGEVLARSMRVVSVYRVSSMLATEVFRPLKDFLFSGLPAVADAVVEESIPTG